MNLLHSNIIGEGKPMIILHGFLGMGDNWKSIAKSIAEWGYEVHLVDQRNHGRSFHSEEFDYGVMAEDVIAYCGHYNLEDIVLMGHSMGGKTAMNVSMIKPALVRKLIVVDISPKYYPSHHDDILKGLNSLDFVELESRGQADKKLSYYVSDFGVRQFLLKNLYWVEKGKLGLRMNLKVLTEETEQVGEPLPPRSQFDGDTLFIRGDRSEYIQSGDQDLILLHFPNAKVVTVSNAGHWVHAENPDEFLGVVKEEMEN